MSAPSAKAAFSFADQNNPTPALNSRVQQHKFNVHAVFRPQGLVKSTCSGKEPEEWGARSVFEPHRPMAQMRFQRDTNSNEYKFDEEFQKQPNSANADHEHGSLCTQNIGMFYTVEVSSFPGSHAALIIEQAEKSGPLQSKTQFNPKSNSLLFQFFDCRDAERFQKFITTIPWFHGIKCEQVYSPTKETLVIDLSSPHLPASFNSASIQFEIYNELSKCGELSSFYIETGTSLKIHCSFYDSRSLEKALLHPVEVQDSFVYPQKHVVHENHLAARPQSKMSFFNQPVNFQASDNPLPVNTGKLSSSMSFLSNFDESCKNSEHSQWYTEKVQKQTDLRQDLPGLISCSGYNETSSEAILQPYNSCQRGISTYDLALKTESISSVDSLSSSSSLGSLNTSKAFKDFPPFHTKFQQHKPSRIFQNLFAESKHSAILAQTIADPSSTKTPRYAGTHVDLESIEHGLEDRCTMMVRNIPNKLGFEEFKKFIDETSFGKYNFLYLRFDFSNHCNVGYAFVSFVSPEHVKEFVEKRNGMDWKQYHHNSGKVIEIRFAKIQGYENLVQKFRNSPVMGQERSWRPRFYYTEGPKAGMEAENII